MRKSASSDLQIAEISVIAKGAGIVFLGTIIGTALRYFFEILTARKLGPELFGLFFIGLAVLKIAEIISTLGLHRGVLRYIAIFSGEKDKERTKGTVVFAFKAVLVVSISLSLLIIFLSKYLALHIFHKPDLAVALKLFSAAIPFTAVTTLFVFSTQGFKIMKYRVLVREIFEPTIRIILLIGVFTLGWLYFGVISAFCASLFMGTFLAYHYLNKVFPELRHKEVRSIFESRKIFGFSWPLFLAEFFSLIIIWINILMIGSYRTSQEVGIYSAAHRTALLGQVILISISAIFSPIVADLYNKNANEKLDQLYKIVTKWIVVFNLPISLAMILFAPEILNLFGKNFLEGSLCLVVLSSAQLLNSAFGSSGFLIMMSGRSKVNLINNLLIVLSNIGLNMILIPKYGIVGAAVSFFISITLINLVMLIEVYIIFRMHPFRIDLYKPIAAGSLSFVALNFFAKTHILASSPLLSLVIFSSIFSAVYILILLMLKIEEEDKIVLQKIKEKFISFRR